MLLHVDCVSVLYMIAVKQVAKQRGQGAMTNNLSCMLRLQGALIACNVYIKNNQRIEHVVASALRRWSTEHNRYDASDSW